MDCNVCVSADSFVEVPIKNRPFHAKDISIIANEFVRKMVFKWIVWYGKTLQTKYQRSPTESPLKVSGTAVIYDTYVPLLVH